MASMSSQKAAPILVILLAGVVGYVGYSGALLDTVGVAGVTGRQEQVGKSRRHGPLGKRPENAVPPSAAST